MKAMERDASVKCDRGEVAIPKNLEYYRNQNVLDSQAYQARHEQGSSQYWPPYTPPLVKTSPTSSDKP